MTLEFNAAEGTLMDLSFNQRESQHPYTTSATNSPPQPSTVMPAGAGAGPQWSIPLDMSSIGSPSSMSSPEDMQNQQHGGAQQQNQMGSPVQQSAASSPLSQHSHHSPFQSPATNPLTDWALQQQQQQLAELNFLQQQAADPTLMAFNPFIGTYPQTTMEYLPSTTTTAALQAGLQAFGTMSSVEETTQALAWNGMMDTGDMRTRFPMNPPSVGSNSPTTTSWEIVPPSSLTSSNGDGNGWTFVDFGYGQPPNAIFNPSQTLHLRTGSGSSDGNGSSGIVGSFEEVPFPYQQPFSPADSDGYVDNTGSHRACGHDGHQHNHCHDVVSPGATVQPMAIRQQPPSTSGRPSPPRGSGSTSPPSTAAKRLSGPRRSAIAKSNKPVRRKSTEKKESADGVAVVKKVGRRRGPLLPEQRKQASEIRKLRACLRCKFLKKTCDKGEPCAGCQPSHARLWQVPCTRIDIKDISYFMKDWKADYDRHLALGVSVFNVKGFSNKETLMWFTHGYGFALPINVREVYVTDSSCFGCDWVESHYQDHEPIDFEVKTEHLDVGVEGISVEALSEYLDKHIDGPFEDFVDDHFEGTPFITEILKTAHRYYVKEKNAIIRKALKLVLAYNLTQHVTMVENQGDEVMMEGQIDDEDSKFYGKTVAPVMVNFQIKIAMAEMWRELQKDILQELSHLYSSVYSGERLKNWPTIFMLASILLAVWEEMQFDCHYRVPDPAVVNKFCLDMETTPVGVIIGLFHAISQKLPPFLEWDTRKHGHVLNNNVAVCEAMTEVREHVTKHEAYLRTRPESKFDRDDFDSLSNKFLSKLVIRAN